MIYAFKSYAYLWIKDIYDLEKGHKCSIRKSWKETLWQKRQKKILDVHFVAKQQTQLEK